MGFNAVTKERISIAECFFSNLRKRTKWFTLLKNKLLSLICNIFTRNVPFTDFWLLCVFSRNNLSQDAGNATTAEKHGIVFRNSLFVTVRSNGISLIDSYQQRYWPSTAESIFCCDEIKLLLLPARCLCQSSRSVHFVKCEDEVVGQLLFLKELKTVQLDAHVLINWRAAHFTTNLWLLKESKHGLRRSEFMLIRISEA